MVVQRESDKFEFLTEVENVVLYLEVLLLERHDELVHDEPREQVLLHNTQPVLEVSEEEYRTACWVELVADAA